MIRLFSLPHVFSASLHGALGAAVVFGGWGDDTPPTPVTRAVPILFESPKTEQLYQESVKHEPPVQKLSRPAKSFPKMIEGVEKEVTKAAGIGTKMCPEKETSQPVRYQGEGLTNPMPSYPLVARKRGHKGTVIVHVKVSEQGDPEEIQVMTSSQSSFLDEAVVAAVRLWHFVPAFENNNPVKGEVEIFFEFVLEGSAVRAGENL